MTYNNNTQNTTLNIENKLQNTQNSQNIGFLIDNILNRRYTDIKFKKQVNILCERRRLP